MKVLVVGKGGRCHAIIDSLSKSKHVDKIYAAPGNDGMSSLATLVNIKETDKEALLSFALENKIDLTVIGPEDSLQTGIVNLFREHHLHIFGPTKEAALIETSKEFAKNLMEKYHIPTASYKVFKDYEKALSYIKEKGVPIVIKYDGLAAGKGVVVAKSLNEADSALKDMLMDEKFGDSSVVIEDYLEGPEFSLMAFVDGENVYPLKLAQDHKRAFDNDLGPNTGGMGAYSGVPIISEEDIKEAMNQIMIPVAKALVNESKSFTGVLYGGLMKTKDGIKVIEFNARFGDPETEVVLPLLKSDLYEAFMAICNHQKPILEFEDGYSMGVVLASKGYPLEYKKGALIENLDTLDLKVYHMGTRIVDGKVYTNGGRVLILVAKGKTLKEAKMHVYNEIKKIKCDDLFYRKDIAHLSLEKE